MTEETTVLCLGAGFLTSSSDDSSELTSIRLIGAEVGGAYVSSPPSPSPSENGSNVGTDLENDWTRSLLL